MSSDPLILAYGRDGQRVACPHFGAAVPSSAVNITILDAGGVELLASTAASKGAFSSTVATAANAGDTSVTSAAVTNLSAGEPIALTEDGETEIANVERVDTTSKLITFEDRLARDYSVGAVLKSAHIYYDADITDTGDFPIGLYFQARFTCADWSSVRSLIFRIVDRETLNPITFKHVRRLIPHVSALRDGFEKAELDGAREAAWQFMGAKLLKEGIDPATIRDPERLAQAGGALAAAFFLLPRPGGAELAADYGGSPIGTGGLFLEWYSLAREIPHWVDRDQDGIRETLEMRSGRKLRRGL